MDVLVSDLSDPDGKKHMARMHALLKQRVERLASLHKNGGPAIAVVLYNETLLIQRALWLINPEACAEAVAKSSVTAAKLQANLCVEDGCTLTVPRDSICPKHVNEAMKDEAEYLAEYGSSADNAPDKET